MYKQMFIVSHPEAIIPTRATTRSAGYDLCSVEDLVIQPGNRALIGTGIKLDQSRDQSRESTNGVGTCDYYWNIRSKSGLAAKYSLDVCAGVVDSDYPQEIKVVLANNGKEPYHVTVGSAIAQMICCPILVFDTVTKERTGGFGSTSI